MYHDQAEFITESKTGLTFQINVNPISKLKKKNHVIIPIIAKKKKKAAAFNKISYPFLINSPQSKTTKELL